MLNNEDIRLFVDIINQDDDAKDKYRRITSINISRSVSRVSSESKSRINFTSTPSNASNLSLSVSNLKFKNKKIRIKSRSKHSISISKSIHDNPLNLMPYKINKEKLKSRMKKHLLRPLTKQDHY